MKIFKASGRMDKKFGSKFRQKVFWRRRNHPIYFSFNMGVKLIDYDTNKAYFNSKDFIKILGYYKEFYEMTASSAAEYAKYKNKRLWND